MYELIISPDVNAVNAIFRLCLSLLLGGLIGIERNRRGQIAGLRTFALITMGATLAMLISIFIPQEYLGLKNGDPGRIAAQVVSGVGFLGAGAIIQMKGSVRGLTTAAGIWMTACIGLAVGAGMYMVSIVATALILFILYNLDRFEHRSNFMWESKIVRIKLNGIVGDLQPCREIFAKYAIRASDQFLRYDYQDNFTVVNFVVLSKNQSSFPEVFKAIHEAYPVISITLTNEVSV
ncbi:MAG: MgtC/SapB family protein [Muribaculaceae bacterium]|nr:MgtC/SapB family protein [Muribaculaceae bacterium]